MCKMAKLEKNLKTVVIMHWLNSKALIYQKYIESKVTNYKILERGRDF